MCNQGKWISAYDLRVGDITNYGEVILVKDNVIHFKNDPANKKFRQKSTLDKYRQLRIYRQPRQNPKESTRPSFSADPCARSGGDPHRKKTRSKKEKHQLGQARARQARGRESGDARRKPNRKPPNGWKGKWPPQKKKSTNLVKLELGKPEAENLGMLVGNLTENH